jgi:hypothetical protein
MLPLVPLLLARPARPGADVRAAVRFSSVAQEPVDVLSLNRSRAESARDAASAYIRKSVYVHMCYLRRRLAASRFPGRIANHHGVGYELMLAA